VVGITDGDTLTLLTPERREVKIRLAEIDTPEGRQP
jgi:endonuclease YncB( thermonuclease family)